MLTSSNLETIKKGQDIVLVGLWLQIVFFGFFIINTIVFLFRMAKTLKQHPAPASYERLPASTPTTTLPWLRYVVVLLLSSIFIIIRCVYRVVEYHQGRTGYLMVHEVFVYVLDGGLMLLVMIAFGTVDLGALSSKHTERVMKKNRPEITSNIELDSGIQLRD